jgi:hypothetical protein
LHDKQKGQWSKNGLQHLLLFSLEWEHGLPIDIYGQLSPKME